MFAKDDYIFKKNIEEYESKNLTKNLKSKN